MPTTTPAYPNRPFARFIQGLCEKHTASVLAAKWKCTDSYVSQLKTGKKRPTSLLVESIRLKTPQWYPGAIHALAKEGLAIPLEINPDNEPEMQLAVLLGMRWGKMSELTCRKLSRIIYDEAQKEIEAKRQAVS